MRYCPCGAEYMYKFCLPRRPYQAEGWRDRANPCRNGFPSIQLGKHTSLARSNNRHYSSNTVAVYTSLDWCRQREGNWGIPWHSSLGQGCRRNYCSHKSVDQYIDRIERSSSHYGYSTNSRPRRCRHFASYKRMELGYKSLQSRHKGSQQPCKWVYRKPSMAQLPRSGRRSYLQL